MIRLFHQSGWQFRQPVGCLGCTPPPPPPAGLSLRGDGKGQEAGEDVVGIEGVLWQTGHSPVSSFIKSDLKAVLGTHL